MTENCTHFHQRSEQLFFLEKGVISDQRLKQAYSVQESVIFNLY
ncbi:MAG: hypothetical protein RI580_10590 [Halothece sp. Uz-M2-17]|nr:hypothetical protein [Halothece sp. Uz-M2-17]